MQKPAKNWYADWFDTSYYHTLYQDRNFKEASLFMDNLTRYLELPENARILDLACGRGRHSVYLNKLGFNVVGVDLSVNNIEFAKKFENDSLRFVRHDMAKTYPEKFDAILNLFTSFGYFDKDEDNLNTIKAIKNALKKNGIGVIDFLNVNQVKKNLVPEETKNVGNILFHIKRFVEDEYIFKQIEFEHESESFCFTEKVKLLNFNDFKVYFKNADVKLLNTFGDYKLNPFNEERSERLILLFK